MNKAIKKIKQFFLFIWNWREHYTMWRIMKRLDTACRKKESLQIKLKYEIIKMIRKYTKMDKDNISKYIPLDEKTKAEIRFQVDLKYGYEMKHLNVKLNKKLQLV